MGARGACSVARSPLGLWGGVHAVFARNIQHANAGGRGMCCSGGALPRMWATLTLRTILILLTWHDITYHETGEEEGIEKQSSFKPLLMCFKRSQHAIFCVFIALEKDNKQNAARTAR